jgi:hypothetical protein
LQGDIGNVLIPLLRLPEMLLRQLPVIGGIIISRQIIMCFCQLGRMFDLANYGQRLLPIKSFLLTLIEPQSEMPQIIVQIIF